MRQTGDNNASTLPHRRLAAFNLIMVIDDTIRNIKPYAECVPSNVFSHRRVANLWRLEQIKHTRNYLRVFMIMDNY